MKSAWVQRWHQVLNYPINKEKIMRFRKARSLFEGNKDKYVMRIRKEFGRYDFELNARLDYETCTGRSIWSATSGPLITRK